FLPVLRIMSPHQAAHRHRGLVRPPVREDRPMAAGWTAMRFGWASYIVPFLFVYSPALIMRGSAVEIVLVMILSIAGIWFVCAAFTGYAMRVMRLPMRVAFAAAGLLLLMPFQASTVNAWLNVLGAVLGVALLIYEFGARSKEAALGGP